MKIVINKCFGGFGLSKIALKELGVKYGHDIHRNDPRLVDVVERLGRVADGEYATLRVLEIPDGVDWDIYEYDGVEHVYDKKRVWGLDDDWDEDEVCLSGQEGTTSGDTAPEAE